MMLTLLSVLSTPVSLSAPRTCRVEDVQGVIVEEGPNKPPQSGEAFQAFIEGCKRHYGQASCPFRIEFNAKTGHTKIFCGNEVNSASKE